MHLQIHRTLTLLTLFASLAIAVALPGAVPARRDVEVVALTKHENTATTARSSPGEAPIAANSLNTVFGPSLLSRIPKGGSDGSSSGSSSGGSSSGSGSGSSHGGDGSSSGSSGDDDGDGSSSGSGSSGTSGTNTTTTTNGGNTSGVGKLNVGCGVVVGMVAAVGFWVGV